MADDDSRFFLFLGDTDKEGVTSKLKTSELEYVKKRLNSGRDNWKKILRLLRDPQLVGSIVSLPSYTMSIAVSASHIDMTREMFSLVKQKPHLVFVHETFFLGRIEVGPYQDIYEFGRIADEDRDAIWSLINEFDLTIAPYKTNAEMSVLASEFVDAHGSNLAFRMYIPHDRLWSKETGVIIGLFRDYLNKISQFKVRQEERSTPLGTVYELYADEAVDQEVLEREFKDFSNLLDTTVADPERARAVLASRNVNDREVIAIVDRYAREARRLQVDLKHDRERKILSIRHRMEAELIETVNHGGDWAAINQLIEDAIPSLTGVSGAINLLPNRASSRSVTVNVNPQIIQTVHGVVAKEIYGNQSFGPNIDDIIKIIQEFAQDQVPQLTSAVYEIEDPETPADKRLSALQKLKSFVYKSSSKLNDVAFGVLQTYIEMKLGLSA